MKNNPYCHHRLCRWPWRLLLVVLPLFVLSHFFSIQSTAKTPSVQTEAKQLEPKNKSAPRSPTSLALSEDKKTLYVAELTGNSIAVVDSQSMKLTRRMPIQCAATGIALHQGHLLVTSSINSGELRGIDALTGKLKYRIKVGQGPLSPVVDNARKRAYICNYFLNSVSVVDLETQREIKQIPVLRLPSAAILSKDGNTLYVANLLPDGPSNVQKTSARISVINTRTTEVVKHIELANGSNALRDLALSADGQFIYATHTLARYLVPTTQLDRGWINTSALSIISTDSHRRYATVVLDDVSLGAPGSWGVDCSENGKHIYVAHSGTHELSIIDAKALMKKISTAADKSELEYDLSMMSDIRKRIPLPGNGPRPILVYQQGVFTAQYFSDDLSFVDFANAPEIRNLSLTPKLTINQVREGEIIFNDASHCFQHWQSCNACHPDEARVDGLNWDILNDGMGNPKKTKSLLFSHFTPPTTVTGCRPNAETSVRAGFTHIQFSQLKEKQYQAVDEYLKSLQPEPSPYLVNGELSDAARRGEKVFKSPSKGACIICHHGPYFTDLKKHKLNNASPVDRTSTWDTPTLREVWRTAPYLHDGRSATVEDVLTKHNHGKANDRLNKEQIDDLIQYVLSL